MNPFYQYFAAENMQVDNGINKMHDAGCAASSGQTVPLISPSHPPDESTLVYPCFEHPTLTDLLDNHSSPITWRWYSDQANSIWTAPNAISHICANATTNGGGSCGSPAAANQDWNNNVKPFLERTNRPNFMPHTTLAPILQDLQNCNFPTTGTMGGVYFVVPDGRWSDHATENIGLGPEYVANIVNLVGHSTCPSPQPNWSNTVILIVWDDWGGWYDHVNPTATIGNGNLGYSNGTGGQYVYGFRVPLLVVSTFAKQHYVSGPIGSPIYYDFGSILQFIESTFQLGTINPVYPYADQFAQHLSDFFDCSGPTCHGFQQVTLQYSSQCTASKCGATQCNSGGSQCLCDTSCFINYNGGPKDPDDE